MPTEDTSLEQADETSLIEDSYLEQETMQQLAACKQLKPPYDEVARMHFYEERTAAEIAKITNNNVKTIQTQIYRAKAMLKKLLQKELLQDRERRAP